MNKLTGSGPGVNKVSKFNYYSAQQIVSSGKYPFSMGQMRHFLLYRHRNGLNKAVRKIGKRLLLRADLFERWIESYGKEGS